MKLSLRNWSKLSNSGQSHRKYRRLLFQYWYSYRLKTFQECQDFRVLSRKINECKSFEDIPWWTGLKIGTHVNDVRDDIWLSFELRKSSGNGIETATRYLLVQSSRDVLRDRATCDVWYVCEGLCVLTKSPTKYSDRLWNFHRGMISTIFHRETECLTY